MEGAAKTQANVFAPVLVFLAYALIGGTSFVITPTPDYAIPIFLPAGIALMAMMQYGHQMVLPIFLGSLATQYAAGHHTGIEGWAWLGTLVPPSGAVLQAAAGDWLARRLVGLPNPFDRSGSILILFSVIAPVSCLVNASVSVPLLVALGAVPATDGLFNWWNWWLGDTLGVVVALPTLLVFFGLPAEDWRPRRWAVAVPMAIAGTLATLASIQVAHWEDQRNTARFNRETEHLSGLVAARLNAQIDMMLAIRSWATITPVIDRSTFHAFVTPWLERYAGTQNFGWSPFLPDTERSLFEQERRDEGFADFTIKNRNASGETFPAIQAGHYLPLTYLEPLASNRRALGLNVIHLPATADAVARARATGQPAVSAPIRLVQEQEQQQGVVVYQAVYANGTGAQSYGERPLRGIVSGTFRMEDVMRATLSGHVAGGIEICLRDPAAETDRQRLYGPMGCDAPGWRNAAMHKLERFAFAGRTWEMDVIATPVFVTASRTWAAWISVVGSLVGLGLLGAFLLITSGSTRRIAGVVAQRTADLTAATRRLEEQQAALTEAQRIAHIGSWEWEAGQPFIRCSEEMERLLGIPGRRLTLDEFPLLFHPEDEGRVADAFRQARLSGNVRHVEARPRQGAAAVEILHLQVEAEQHGGQTASLRGTLQDVTAIRNAEAHINHLAHFDVLTGLPNRHHWLDRAKTAIAIAGRHREQLAVLFLDLDRFKTVNDSLGHPVGDKLLAMVATRLSSCLRGEDFLARLGGDEFVVLLERIEHAAEAGVVAHKMITALAEPFDLDGHDFTLTVSIGIALFPTDSQNIDGLLQQADVAMYSAKAQGRNTYQYFAPEMTARASERLQLEAALRRALERREFELHYQPQVDVRSGRANGGEALIRWRHPERGLIPPAVFIPVAEESGLILQIGEWVLEEVFSQQVRWREAGLPPLRLAANISAIQFGKHDFVATVERLLQKTGADPARLELEVTESALMNLDQSTMDRLVRLRNLGFTLALDDFGMGYSSLGYLKRLPITRLKVDRSFVANLPEDQEDAAIAMATLSIARDLDMGVVAEGVETEAQLAFFAERGCTEMQGFLFAQALPPEEFAAYVRRHGSVAQPA